MTYAETMSALAEIMSEVAGAEFSARLEGGVLLIHVSGGDSGGSILPLEGGDLADAIASAIRACTWGDDPWGLNGPYEGDDGREWFFIGEVR